MLADGVSPPRLDLLIRRRPFNPRYCHAVNFIWDIGIGVSVIGCVRALISGYRHFPKFTYRSDTTGCPSCHPTNCIKVEWLNAPFMKEMVLCLPKPYTSKNIALLPRTCSHMKWNVQLAYNFNCLLKMKDFLRLLAIVYTIKVTFWK